jgi:HPt (histidine-containing phosphotransfer) domain-containing protein
MAVLDLEHLKRIVGSDPAFIRQVLQIFVRTAPKDMAALSESVEQSNHEQIGFNAHKLKSAAGAIGYNQAYEDFKILESMARDRCPIGEIAEMVNRMNGECMECMNDIEKILDKL